MQPSKTGAMKRFASLALIFGMFAVGNVVATTYTWDGDVTKYWNNASNWDALPVSAGTHTLVFNAAGTAVPNQTENDLANPFSLNVLTVGTTMTFAGSDIELAGTSPAVNFAAGITLTFNNGLKISTANATFRSSVSSANTSTIIFNGQLTGGQTLRYANTSPASTTPNPTFKFAYTGGANTINGFTLGDLTDGRGKATIEVAMDDPFGGSSGSPTMLTFANSGACTIKGIGSARMISSTISLRNNLTFSGKGLTFGGNFSISSTGSSRTLANNLDAGEALVFAAGPGATFNSANGASTLLLTGSSSAVTVIPGVVSDSKMMNSGMGSYTGILRLTGANTYTAGNTAIAGWTLEFNSVENSGSATASALGKPTVNGTTEIIALGSTTTAGTLKYIGTNTLGHSTDRPLNLAGSTGGATVDASGTGPISFLGGVYATGGGDKTLTLQGTNTSNNTLGGVISNSTGFATALVKDGVGTWLLTGANTYTGTTTVKGGKLMVNGSLDAGTSVTVTNATLGGTGTLNGNLTVQSSGLVAPGTSVGTLTNNLTGSKTATFATGAKFAFELGAPGTSDVMAFTGLTGNQVTFNSNVIDFSNAGSWGAGTYTLFTFDASSAYTGTLVIGTGLESFDPSSQFIYNANNIQLQVVAAVSQPTVTIVKTTDGAEEGPLNATFTVTRDNVGTSNPLTVYYAVAGTSTSGSDFTALSGSVVIDANLTSATITVPVLQDNDFAEGIETVIVTLSADATYIVGAPNSATADIADGNKPEVSIVKTTDGAEAGPVNGIFTVSRTAGETTNYALTVNYTVDVSSTATSGSDYTALSGSVSIGAGQTNATIVVPVLQDSDFTEGTETVIVNLSADAAYTVGTPGSATVNITDGNKPVVTILKTTHGAEAGPVNGTFTVYRSTDNGTASALTVDYSVDVSSTATSGSDYTALSGSATIGVGQTNAIITVAVLQDILFAEGTESVILNLSAHAGYTVGASGSATVDITDGIKPDVNIVKASDGSEVGPANGSFTISRSPESASSGPVTVYFTTNGSTATAGSDYTALDATNVTMILNVTNATIHVKVLRDSLTEGAEGVQLNLLENSGYTIGDFGSAIVSIEDDIPPAVGERRDFTALYTFSNSVQGSVMDPTPPPYEKGIIFGSFSMVGGTKIGANGIAGAFYANEWDVSDTNQVVNRYFEVTLMPVDKVEMTITNISFDVARQNSGGAGPTRYAMRSSLDNYATNLLTFTSDPANTSLSVMGGDTLVIGGADTGIGVWQTGGALSPDNSFLKITNSVTFRVYGWNNSPDKDGGIDNFAIRGTWVLPAPRGTMISFQ